MAVVTLEGFVPGARYDGVAWTQARIEEGPGPDGPWTAVETKTLSPVDSDPTNPQERNFTTSLASSSTGYFRVVFLDPSANEQPSGATYVGTAAYVTKGETAQQLVTQIKEEGGFDITDTQALRVLNARHRRMVAEAEAHRVALSLGSTVADQASYLIDEDVVAITSLQVGNHPWTRIGVRDLEALQAGRLRLRGSGGVFAPTFSAGGEAQVTLYPAPSESGNALEAWAAVLPPDMDLSDRPLVPPDFHEALVEGSIATLLARMDERLGEADRYEARFDQAVQRLKRRVKARVGTGPIRIRLAA